MYTLFSSLISLLACAVTTSPTNEGKGFDLKLLAGMCKEQRKTDECSENAQFCAEINECPQQHICICKLNCGRLLCVIPDTVKGQLFIFVVFSVLLDICKGGLFILLLFSLFYQRFLKVSCLFFIVVCR